MTAFCVFMYPLMCFTVGAFLFVMYLIPINFTNHVQVKPVMKRILRRRANEPAPAPEKRRKPLATTLTFQLDERDIEADLRAIARHSPPPRHAPQTHRKHLNSTSCEFTT